MAVDERLAKKGMGEPREGLIEQGLASAELATKNAAALAEENWSPEKTAELKSVVGLLETEVAEQIEARTQLGSAGDDRERAIDDAKAFIRRLRLAIPECLQTTAVKTVKAESFEINGGGSLRRSPRKISQYLLEIRPSVEALDEDLKPFFRNTAPSTLLDARKTQLDAANAVRHVVIGELPEATQGVYEAKGRVLELIENLNRAGKRAFDGDATKIAQFNKDLLLAARKKRKKKETEDETKKTT